MGSISFSQILGSRVSCEACGGNVVAIKLKKNIFYSRIKSKNNNSGMMYSWIKSKENISGCAWELVCYLCR